MPFGRNSRSLCVVAVVYTDILKLYLYLLLCLLCYILVCLCTTHTYVISIHYICYYRRLYINAIVKLFKFGIFILYHVA